MSCPGAPRVLLCSVCSTPMHEHKKIVPEAATNLVQLCGLHCYQSWRDSLPVVARLAARGSDLSIGE
jgi:hypothetical protein